MEKDWIPILTKTELVYLLLYTGASFVGCPSCYHQWLVRVPVGVEPRLSGHKSIALISEPLLLLAFALYWSALYFFVACSPAQAAAAPALMMEHSTGNAMMAAQYGRYTGRNTAHEQYPSSQLGQSPRVVCETLRSDIQVHASLEKWFLISLQRLLEFMQPNVECRN